MNLNQQVVSLEIAKRLKELGVKQESLFSYKQYVIEKHNTEVPVIKYHEGYTERVKQEHASNLYFISAFTTAELGEMLPNKIDPNEAGDERIWLYTWKGERGFSVGYGEVISEISGTASFNMPYVEDADTEADARAKMLIYLLENQLITL